LIPPQFWAYRRLAKGTGFGFSWGSEPDAGQPFVGDLVAAAVRQVAHEVSETVEREASRFL